MKRNWIKHENEETYSLFIEGHRRGYVTRYKIVDGYNWQAHRGDTPCASGSAPTAEAAKHEAERHIDMTTAEFTASLALALIKDRDGIVTQLAEIEAQLAKIGHSAPTADRYAIGYTEGFEAARQAILDALEARRAQVPA